MYLLVGYPVLLLTWVLKSLFYGEIIDVFVDFLPGLCDLIVKAILSGISLGL